MKLTDLEVEERAGWHRLSAAVVSEDSDHPRRRLWFEVRPSDAALLATGWEAFVVAAYPLALSRGERRLAVAGPLCPRLCDDLAAYGQSLPAEGATALPPVEAAGGRTAPLPGTGARTACLLSGGVDSLAMLRANHVEYRSDHPGRIRTGVTIFGLNSFDLADGSPVADREHAFTASLDRLEAFGKSVGVHVMPVRTNVRDFYPDFATWGRYGSAAGTIAAGHAVGGAVRTLWFASDGDSPVPSPRIAQPFHVHLLSTAAVEVHLGQRQVGRFEKTAMVASWPEARAILRCCTYYRLPPPGSINCGECEKCVRTRLTLLALGRLRDVDAFDRKDLVAADLRVLEDEAPDRITVTEFYMACVGPLRAAGREDLADPLEEMVARMRRREALEHRPSLRQRVERLLKLAP